MRGLELLAQHGVDWNVLCTVNAANQDHPLEVYRFFRDDLGARHIQLIPIVERDNDTGFQEGDTRHRPLGRPRRVGPLPDRRVRRVGAPRRRHRVRAARSTPRSPPGSGSPPALCIFAETCGNAVALEHNGDLYSCDHFVEPDYLLGNITETHMVELLARRSSGRSATPSATRCPRYCRECEVRFACNGECPKNRFTLTPDGEPGLNYLCAGYKAFFTHIDGLMRIMADLLRRGRYADEVMTVLASAAQRPVPLRQRPQGQALPRSIATGRLGGTQPGYSAASTKIAAPTTAVPNATGSRSRLVATVRSGRGAESVASPHARLTPT